MTSNPLKIFKRDRYGEWHGYAVAVVIAIILIMYDPKGPSAYPFGPGIDFPYYPDRPYGAFYSVGFFLIVGGAIALVARRFSINLVRRFHR